MSRRPIQAGIRSSAPEAREEGAALREKLREALSRWASGVAVLAVNDGEEVDAITVTAFSAVSLDPPLVLVCVNEQSASLPMLLEERRFTLNVLADDERGAATAFAQRLPIPEPRLPAEGDAVLRGALVSLVCRLWREYPGGDHRILVGEVERIEFGRESGPLVYFRREYRGLGGPAGE